MLTVDAEAPIVAPDQEYPNLYRHFAGLVNDRQSDVDADTIATRRGRIPLRPARGRGSVHGVTQ